MPRAVSACVNSATNNCTKDYLLPESSLHVCILRVEAGVISASGQCISDFIVVVTRKVIFLPVH